MTARASEAPHARTQLPRVCISARPPRPLALHPAPPAPPGAAVKAAGKWRQEGKTYEVQDGDIIHW